MKETQHGSNEILQIAQQVAEQEAALRERAQKDKKKPRHEREKQLGD